MPELVNRLKKGDEQAFSDLFQIYWKKLFTAAYRRINDEQLAQDITQDVFMQLWDRRESLNVSADNLEFYLLKSVKNKVIDHFNSGQAKQEVLKKVILRMDEIQTEFDPKRYRELESFVDSEVDRFPQTMKAVYLLRSEQLSVKQIAQNLNLAEQTVKNNITDALGRLRNSLNKKFIDEDFAVLFIVATLMTKL